jgi:uncharacterized coiled-coil protein SlyX
MFNSNEAMKSARSAHEHLESWIQVLLTLLTNKGVNREQASLRMAALIERVGAVSSQFPPPIVSLALTFLLNYQIDQTSASLGQSEMVSELRKAVTGLGEGLAAVLKEEGWKKDDVTRQMSLLTDKLLAVSEDSGGLVFTLTVAVTLDNYAKFLVKETLLPRNP